MKRFEHGGNYSSDILDFSVNINPLGIPDSVKKVLIDNIDKFSDYPDPDCKLLIQKLSVFENIKPDKIVCGNGAADLIYRFIYAVRPKNALLAAPTFSEYEKALSEINCNIRFHMLNELNDFIFTERILDDLQDTDIFFLCNPNNPTGSAISQRLFLKISEKCIKNEIFLVVDECFMGFSENQKRYTANLSLINKNTVIIKAFTKLYAMAGLRLGYMLFGDTALAEKVRSNGQCWSVSTVAQLAGSSALNDKEYLKKSVLLIKKERKYLSDSLKQFGFKVYPSETNYLFFYCPFRLNEMLLRKKIAIRSCENYYGLNKNYFRIAVRNHEDNKHLIYTIKSIMEHEKWQK